MVLLFSSSVFAQPVSDYNRVRFLKMHFSAQSGFSFQTATGSKPRIDFVAANLTFFPREEPRATITNMRYITSPQISVVQGDDALAYLWNDPSSSTFQFGLEADVQENNVILPIIDKVRFPVQNLETYYTQPSEYIDIDDSIRSKAQELAVGQDDLYIVSFLVAAWVQSNVKYDLSSLTADVVQKSSWVFQNKQGVCDELTNLFISMMRSLGVPARFVSGIAYTNMGYKWVPHAWAEVYFPNKGWVPFDLTFGEYGWIDPGHIKLKVSLDSGDASVKYLWRTYDGKFKGTPVDLKASAVQIGDTLPPLVNLKVKPLLNQVAPGSFVPFEVTVENPHEYYFPETIVVLKSHPLTENNVQRVLLKPHGTEKLYWIMQLPNDADKGFIYTSFLEVEDSFHTLGDANVTYLAGGTYSNLQDAQNLIEKAQHGSVALKTVGFLCTPSSPYAYPYETLTLSCTLKNLGDHALPSLQVCYTKQCQALPLGINQAKEVIFSLPKFPPGLQKLVVTAEGDDVNAQQTVELNVLENPDLLVTRFAPPTELPYNTVTNLTFVMSVKAPVKDVILFVNKEKIVSLPSLESSKKVYVPIYSNTFVHDGSLNLTITYKDRNHKQYSFTKENTLTVTNVPFIFRILQWLKLY